MILFPMKVVYVRCSFLCKALYPLNIFMYGHPKTTTSTVLLSYMGRTTPTFLLYRSFHTVDLRLESFVKNISGRGYNSKNNIVTCIVEV